MEVKVEVDRIPSEHLNKHQVRICVSTCGTNQSSSQELLEHANYIEEEREYLGEQLNEMEKEVDKERKQREDLEERLLELQRKVLIDRLLLYSNLILDGAYSLPGDQSRSCSLLRAQRKDKNR